MGNARWTRRFAFGAVLATGAAGGWAVFPAYAAPTPGATATAVTVTPPGGDTATSGSGRAHTTV